MKHARAARTLMASSGHASTNVEGPRRREEAMNADTLYSSAYAGPAGHLRTACAELQMAQAVFAQFRYPMVLVDEARGIWEANAAAREILRTSDVLHDHAGVLACSSPEDTHALTETIRTLQRSNVRADARSRRSALSLQRADGSRLHLFVSLVRPDECMGLFGKAVRALVIIHDGQQGAGDLDPGLVAESFSLTPAEARVAVKLAEGRTVKDIATEHRTSVATVRCQVQQALQKAGVTRQTDLVRLLLALPFRC